MLQVIGPDGFSIVSDIDDTIRITEVTKPLNALKNTFCKPFVPANGMPQLYSTLIKKLSTPSSPLQMHYVSGSPEELAVPLQNFISQHYTAGSMDLRRFAPSESDMWQGTQPHKLIAIDSLMEIFPQRKFVLIGDSGEQDPDTYAKIFNKWSPQNRTITCIFIRKVEGADNSEARFNKDFTGVPREKWVVFDDPKVVESADIANGKCA
ncbi:hypothetical protein BKA69DRAFT_793967 [Paraphysoderma sedebokerense]|nr:hypothetical protein BKA69DRAFT_793967 [Paraphysoderma sedebokerense]